MVTGFLLDTNVLSELRKGPQANAAVRRWDWGTRETPRFTSVMVIAELRRGARLRLRQDRESGSAINRWVDRVVQSFGERIFPVDLPTIEIWAELMVSRSRSPMDALISATALARNLTLVTRNIRDFADTGAAIVDPWSEA